MIDIQAMVEDYVVNKERSTGTLHPSAIDGCSRREILRATGAKEAYPMDHPLQWTLRRYGTYEKFFTDAFRSAGVLIEPESGDQHELRHGVWHGYLDALIKDGAESAIVEIKSVNPGALKHGNLPYDHHVEQAQAYYVMMRRNSGIRVGDVNYYPDTVHIVYITRWDDGKLPEFRQFDVTPDGEEFCKIEDKMALLASQLLVASEIGTLPEIPYEGPEEHRWNCTGWNWKEKRREIRCPFFGECWPGRETDYGVDPW